MQRYNYDKKTLYVFDTIGTYFINIFYNSAYQAAYKRFESGAVSSLTDAYREFSIKYLNGIRTDREFYITVIDKLHSYYHEHGGVASLLMSDFENIVVSKFIPAEYFNVMTSADKDRVMHEIISKTIGRFVVYLLDAQNLRKVIDERSDRKHVLSMQEHITNLFMVTREEYVSQFVDKNIADQDRRIGTVDKNVFDKLKTACITETKKRVDVENNYVRAINIIKQLSVKINKLETLTHESHNQPCTQCSHIATDYESLQRDYAKLQTDYKLSLSHIESQKKSCSDLCINLEKISDELKAVTEERNELRKQNTKVDTQVTGNRDTKQDTKVVIPPISIETIPDDSPEPTEDNFVIAPRDNIKSSKLDDWGYPEESVSDDPHDETHSPYNMF